MYGTKADRLKPKLSDATIAEHFSNVVKQYPDKVAIKTPQETLTYEDLDDRSNAFALALQRSFGVRPGDRVAMSLGTSVPHIVVSARRSASESQRC